MPLLDITKALFVLCETECGSTFIPACNNFGATDPARGGLLIWHVRLPPSQQRSPDLLAFTAPLCVPEPVMAPYLRM